MEHKGIFVVIEGTDGSGKTESSKYIRQQLEARGIEPTMVRQPGGTPIAEDCRRLLKTKEDDYRGEEMLPLTEYLLVSAARHQLTQHVILPDLMDGKVVISDRHDLSTKANQEIMHASLDKQITLPPDITIYLDRPFEATLQSTEDRGDECRMEAKGPKFLEMVAKRYKKYIDIVETGHLVKVDASDFDSVQFKTDLDNAVELIMAYHQYRSQPEQVRIVDFEHAFLNKEGIRIICRCDSGLYVPEYDFDEPLLDTDTVENLRARLDVKLKGIPYAICGRIHDYTDSTTIGEMRLVKVARKEVETNLDFEVELENVK